MALPVNPATTTTAVDLLYQLKKILLHYQKSTLSGVRTFKLGVLPPQPIFPAINIMPEEETYQYNYNGGKYEVLRSFLFEIYARHDSPAHAMETARDLVGFIKEILKINQTLDGVAVDLEFHPRIFEELISFHGKYLQIGTIPIRVLSYEFLPINRVQEDRIVSTTSSELINEIFQTLLNCKLKSGQFSLRNVAQFEKSRIPPIPKFPAITVTEPQLDQNRTYTGLDAGNRDFEVSIYTRLLDKDALLTDNLKILEVVKDVLQLHHRFGGRCIHSWVDSVQFLRQTLDIGSVYTTTLRLKTQSQEINPT